MEGLVKRSEVRRIVDELHSFSHLALDLETTGLRMFHGDTFFSVIIAPSADKAYYFNFNPVDHWIEEREEKKKTVYLKHKRDLPEEIVLTKEHMEIIAELFKDGERLWFIQNAANFDLSMLSAHGYWVNGKIHCTRAIGRVQYNEHLKYSLEAQLERIGDAKDDRVKAYVDKYHLKTKFPIPGKDTLHEVLHYDQVPLSIMVPYGLQDAKGTFKLGNFQMESIIQQDNDDGVYDTPRALFSVYENECRLQPTIHRMKHTGVAVDLEYCKRASEHERTRGEGLKEEFKKLTGEDFVASSKLFEKVFASDRHNWGITKKGNPSFESDALMDFENPAAKVVLDIRNAKSKSDFYNGFLWFVDEQGNIHPNYNPEGTVHGRFSSNEPNFQNLTAEDLGECKACGTGFESETLACKKCGSTDLLYHEFLTRRALIPRPGYIFIMPDYDQMEYKFMLEQACRLIGRSTKLSEMIADGMDFHDATGLNVKNVTGMDLPRKSIKVVNFMTLYGSGNQNVANTLGIPLNQARLIREAIFEASPEIRNYIRTVSQTGERMGFIRNWLGRKCHLSVKRFSYKLPNYHTSGGCADVVKKAMNGIDEYLKPLPSRMVMTIHDELPIEVHESEISFVPKRINEIMENAYESKYVPLTTGMEWSRKSLADKVKGFPNG